MSRNFTWKGAAFSVIDSTVEAAIDADYVAILLADGESVNRRQYNKWQQYGEFLATVSVTSGDPGFSIPSLDDDNDTDVRAFYTVFVGLPKEFRDAWSVAKWSDPKGGAPTEGGN